MKRPAIGEAVPSRPVSVGTTFLPIFSHQATIWSYTPHCSMYANIAVPTRSATSSLVSPRATCKVPTSPRNAWSLPRDVGCAGLAQLLLLFRTHMIPEAIVKEVVHQHKDSRQQTIR